MTVQMTMEEYKKLEAAKERQKEISEAVKRINEETIRIQQRDRLCELLNYLGIPSTIWGKYYG